MSAAAANAAAAAGLVWSAQLDAVVNPGRLVGDKIKLPQSALEQLLQAAPVVTEHDGSRDSRSTFDPFNPYSFAAERVARAESAFRNQQLPHPLTFRLVNPSTGRVVYAGISEFSADDGLVGLSQFLAHALGIDPAKDDRVRITVHAKQVPKGTFVKLRPLEAGYDPDDWKSLLEDHMRKNYTTLTRGEVLTVPAGRDHFQFLIDELKPAEQDAICVVDTDLEVDLEPLNEEQALETLKQIAAKRKLAPGSAAGSSTGGTLDLFAPKGGQVLPGEYVDYELPSWDRSSTLEIEVRAENPEAGLCLFASPFSSRQRARPREDEHVFADFEGQPARRLLLSPTNVELEAAEALWISVFAPASDADQTPQPFGIRARPREVTAQHAAAAEQAVPADSDQVICANCKQAVPKQSLVLHENFCRRNNIPCPHGCGRVFLRASPALASHWHCPHDSSTGDNPSSKQRHDQIWHTPQTCPACSFSAPSLPLLAQHRTSTCPGKIILCRFCHLQVPQEGDPDDPQQMAEASISGLTAHELDDGGRTTECHLCGRITRLRDMETHLKHHDLERKSRPTPRLCRNVNCGRTMDGATANGDTRAHAKHGQQDTSNDIGMCSTCFGPLYVSMYDPEGKSLKRRVERRYLTQLLTGCGHSHCRNEFCKTGKINSGMDPAAAAVSTKDALPLIKPFLDGLLKGSTPLHFCTDERAQQNRTLAGLLAAEGDERVGQRRYGFEWCVAALEAENGDAGRARDWLKNFAPSTAEV